MYIEILIFVLVLIIQFSIASFAWSVRRNIPKKYSKALSSGLEVGKCLETIAPLLEECTINIKVLKNMGTPAIGKNQVLYINKESIYRTDLYSNYLVLVEVVMLIKAAFFRNIYKFQLLFHFFTLITFALGIVLYSIVDSKLINVAIAFSIGSIVFSFIVYLIQASSFEKMQLIANEIMQMDDVEEARSETLNKELRLRVFEYPLRPVISMVNFLKP